MPPSTPVCVVSPDPGGLKRAERLRRIEPMISRTVSLAVMEKTRGKGVLTAGRLIGEVDGSYCIIIDDLIGTGSTLVYAARACRKHGAAGVVAAAAHGLFVGDAAKNIGADDLDAVAITDTVPPFRLPSTVIDRNHELCPPRTYLPKRYGGFTRMCSD
ncbi:MAG: phosphoribosyltransferase family protein [Gammaproteobacteria bacterium]